MVLLVAVILGCGYFGLDVVNAVVFCEKFFMCCCHCLVLFCFIHVMVRCGAVHV